MAKWKHWPWSERPDDVLYEAIQGMAESHCPADIVAFGRRHKIENFAVATWQNGFRSGWLAAQAHFAKNGKTDP